MFVFRSLLKRTPRQQGNRYRPRLERLELRRMLSADPWLDSIDGGSRADVDHDRFHQHPWSGPNDNASRGGTREATVMSWNLYLGGDLAPVLNAVVTGDPQQIVQASSEIWQSVLATNFEVRAEAIANQIELAQTNVEKLVVELISKRSGKMSPQVIDNIWRDSGKKKHEMPKAVSDRVSDMPIHEDETGTLQVLANQVVPRPMTKGGL